MPRIDKQEALCYNPKHKLVQKYNACAVWVFCALFSTLARDRTRFETQPQVTVNETKAIVVTDPIRERPVFSHGSLSLSHRKMLHM